MAPIIEARILGMLRMRVASAMASPAESFWEAVGGELGH